MDAGRVIALAPDLAEGYVALRRTELEALKFEAAEMACGRAPALAPSYDRVLYDCSLLAAYLTAISGARRRVVLDPLNPLSHRALADTLRYARRSMPSLFSTYSFIIRTSEQRVPPIVTLFAKYLRTDALH